MKRASSALPIVLFMLIATTYGGGSAVAAPASSARDSLKFTRLSVKTPASTTSKPSASLFRPGGRSKAA